MKTSEFYPKKPQNRFFTHFLPPFPSPLPDNDYTCAASGCGIPRRLPRRIPTDLAPYPMRDPVLDRGGNFMRHFVRIRHISVFFRSFLQINSAFVQYCVAVRSLLLLRSSDIFRQKKPPQRELVRGTVKRPKRQSRVTGPPDGTHVVRTLLIKVTATLYMSLCRSALSRLKAKVAL